MNFTQREKTIISVAATVCIICFICYTFIHIIYYHQLGQSDLNFLPDSTVPFEINFIKTSIYFCCISFLTLLYYSIKKVIYNHKTYSKNKFFHISILVIILFLFVYNPFSIEYIFNHPYITNYVILLDFIHFSGIVFLFFFLFKSMENNIRQ
jgi:hypothetical protein